MYICRDWKEIIIYYKGSSVNAQTLLGLCSKSKEKEKKNFLNFYVNFFGIHFVRNELLKLLLQQIQCVEDSILIIDIYIYYCKRRYILF